MLVAMLLSLVAAIAWKNRPSPHLIVLVANFDGRDPQKYRVTEIIIERLREATRGFPDVRIHALGKAITELEGSEAAHGEGSVNKARIVLWGWYAATDEVVHVNANFEVLEPIRSLILRHTKALDMEAVTPPQKLLHGDLEESGVEVRLGGLAAAA